jgi:N-methylhydantoinase A
VDRCARIARLAERDLINPVAVSVGVSVGIDVGGTFTDLAAVGADGRVITRKVLSTPSDQSEGVAAALEALGADPSIVERIAHGTTVVTNLLLERRGARTVLCATAGATDLLELRRQDRIALYDLSADHPAPLVPAGLVVPVHERRIVGGVKVALTAAEAARVADAVAALDPEIVVVSLLHAYENAEHEALLASAIRARLPQTPVVCSADVLPEIREYERTATAVAEGYAQPRVSTYLEHLSARLAAQGYPAPNVMTSGGGMRTAAEASTAAASLALSGPAGGVVGAAAVLRAAGLTRLILDGEPLVEPGGNVAGVPIALPRVLVETVSAGGGSIAWKDDGGALRVGPRSAGAVPGPVAFGRGGTQPTVTDAHAALGHFEAATLSGGVTIDSAAAREAVTTLAYQLGADTDRTAAAIIAIADAEMARALRRVSVERGIDPRSCALVAFGGGGPLHACALAELLGMTTILVPPHAGVLSALGLAIAPERRDAATSVMTGALALSERHLGALLQDLAHRADEAYATKASAWHARVRYAGQGHELDIACAPGDSGVDVAERFAVAHRARYGFTLDRAVEIVALRVAVSGSALPVSFVSTEHADRRVIGPAVEMLTDCTMVVAAGWTARPLSVGGWMVERP